MIAEATDVQKPSAVLRIYGTVRLQSGPNSSSARSVGLQLVAEGLAVCTRRREERSAEYEALQIAEAEASVKAKVGISHYLYKYKYGRFWNNTL